jgi:hypothetical protein
MLSTQTYSTQRETEWCERRLLARIHRLTVGMLRKQIEPVTAAAFMRWLMRWQHVAPGTQVVGERGTLEVLQQLQGFEIPANAWERQVLSRRIVDYDPKWLDQLCLTGAVGWGRLSPHPATIESAGSGNGNGDAPTTRQRRVIPTSVAPITFFVREEADWMIPRENSHFSQKQGEVGHPASSHSASSHPGSSYLATACYISDLMPTTAHIELTWGMGFDLYPLDTIESKREYYARALPENWLTVFTHDPNVPWARIEKDESGKMVAKEVA